MKFLLENLVLVVLGFIKILNIVYWVYFCTKQRIIKKQRLIVRFIDSLICNLFVVSLS